MNVRFNYLYRDASNYKCWGSTVFSDPTNQSSTLHELEARLRNLFMVDGTFIAHQLGVPELFPYAPGRATQDDHCLHEFHGLEQTAAEPNDMLQRTFSAFIDSVERASREGWQGFDASMPFEERKFFKFAS